MKEQTEESNHNHREDDFVLDKSTPEERKLLKHIERRAACGWIVRFHGHKLEAQKFFGDRKFGGTWLALAEAVSYRDKMYRRIRNREKRLVRAAQEIVKAQAAQKVQPPAPTTPEPKRRGRKAKLSDKDVRDIRGDKELTNRQIATIYGISPSYVSQLKSMSKRAEVN